MDNGTTRTTGTERDYSVGLVSQYEIDLWGRIKSLQQAAVTSAKASREDVRTAAMSIAAEVAGLWIDIRARRLEKRLLNEQLKLNRTILELVELRFSNGMVSALDVFQQKQVIADTKGEIPLVVKQEQLLLNQLAVLCGRTPGSDLGLGAGVLPEIVAPPAAGLPAALLSSRPDIRAAGLRLETAKWQVAEARANRLPAIRLTARGEYGADRIETLFDNWLINLAANLTAPLMDGGYRKAEVERLRSVVDERVSAYGRTVLVAVREVEDALTGETQQQMHLHWLKEEVKAARRALEEASFRYRSGLNDYLPVLTQLLSVQRLERDLIRQQALLLQSRIDLYRALGGDWDDDLLSETGR
jgi:NodT family efflux transporter outer membrane factor (OMF) lipoprotein